MKNEETYPSVIESSSDSPRQVQQQLGQLGGYPIAVDESRYDRVIDVVEAGADNTGGTSIVPLLQQLKGDNTLLKFPPGRYYMDDEVRLTGFVNFGVIAPNGATLVPADYETFNAANRRLFRLGVYYAPGRDLRFGGFSIDQRAPNTGIRVLEAEIADGLDVRNVEVIGQHSSGTGGPGLFNITDPAGSGTVERFWAQSGSVPQSQTPRYQVDPEYWGPTGILSTAAHQGTITYRACRLGSFADNGLYCVTTGTTNVSGGIYQNSHNSQVRLGGVTGTIQNVTVRVDRQRDPGPSEQRGIRIQSGSNYVIDNATVTMPQPSNLGITIMDDNSSTTIRNSSVSMGSVSGKHGIVIYSGAGTVTVSNTTVTMNGSANAVQVNGEANASNVLLDGITVTGNAPGTTWRESIRIARPGTELRNVTVNQPGSDNRDGVFVNANNVLVTGGGVTKRHGGRSESSSKTIP
ncbi:hypothetical protein SAMN05421858_3402 [Haladaptatus litoreus]|uniref:Right handed beta helix region n=2 Tax=Haladaptatus litoreus TaxID=553468 RepID=A0A1N7D1A6_9EURY|nr:hypothetical protein SAMN05421858_3402 [Haladaptatus litoreus]